MISNQVVILFVIITAMIYMMFDKVEITLIELNYEKTLKNRLYINEGSYIELTDSEISLIKEKVNDEARGLIEAVEEIGRENDRYL